MRARVLLIALTVCANLLAQPATMAGFSDEGTFVLYAHEGPLARLTFQWKPTRHLTSRVVLSLGGQSAVSPLIITPDADGRWLKVTDESPTSKAVWEREGENIKFDSPDRKGKGRWPKDALTFDSWTPPLIALALRRFDVTGDNPQT